MDRAIQERVVGATILVIFIVLVVPVFLDGPAMDDEIVSETVVLPGQNSQPRKRQTIVLQRDRTEPVPQQQPSTSARRADAAPASSTKAPAEKESVPEEAAPVQASPAQSVATPDPEPAEPETEPPPAPAPPAAGMWAVQLGSFSKKDNAERLAAGLRQKGYAAFLSQLESANGPLHRVRIGPQKDRDSAQAVVARLATDGQKGQVVPHP